MLLAEAFVLLALNADGTPAHGSNQPNVAMGVVGALVTELVLDGHLDLSDGRIRLAGSKPTAPLLVLALQNLAPHEGKKHSLHATRHPVVDATAHARLRAEVHSAAIGEGPLDPRHAALLALAGPCRLLEVVAPDRADRAQAKRRIAEAAERVPAAAAVKYAIEAAAVAAVVGA